MQEKMNYITSEMRNKTEHHDFLFDQTVKFLKNHIVRRLDFLESVIRNTGKYLHVILITTPIHIFKTENFTQFN